MSVAFRRESDEEHLEPKFELPIPPGPNFVTPAGLAQIEERVAGLEQVLEAASEDEERKRVLRDLRYWRSRFATAQPAPAPREGKVGIGSRVRFIHSGKSLEVLICGYDEADPGENRIAFSAPLARALLGAKAGDFADFAGADEAIEVVSVENG
ncbi:MAG TPA: GreA/GreB family elongation factor [Sphingomicrobium sp.]|nr:GreA/GreB family elongation factor [Sphingomicrobium sp.]